MRREGIGRGGGGSPESGRRDARKAHECGGKVVFLGQRIIAMLYARVCGTHSQSSSK
jgi:hypothetical protein